MRILWLPALAGAVCLVGRAEAQIFTFQNGNNGYDGTLDTEFRDTDPANGLTPDRGQQLLISIDQTDSDIVGQPGRTQGAIRFEDFIGNGPGQIAPGTDILFADVVVYVRNSTDPEAVISFDRVLGADQGTSCSEINDPGLCDPNEPTEIAARDPSPGIWDENDSWFSLGGSVVGVPSPLDENLAVLPFDPIETGNSSVLGVGSEAVQAPEDPTNPGDGRLLAEFNITDEDFVSIEVTDSVRRFLSGEVNAGWAINSTSGNGWDFLSSDYTFEEAIALGGGEAALAAVFAEAGLTEADVRPELRVVVGAVGDIDFDGDIDPADFEILRSGLGSRNGSQDRGLNGDLNFDFDIDLEDFAAFRAAFEAENGVGSFAPLLATVPEPASGLLLLSAFPAFAARRR